MRHALPQNLHIMPEGYSKTRLCGSTTGGYVRERDAAWLARFLRDGGHLCPECAKRRAQPEEAKA
jgi:hypothetical protein